MERDALRTQGDWLLYLRRRAGWTHVHLADAATVSHDTISHIERGKERSPRGRGRGPNAATIQFITAALAARFEDLTRPGNRELRLSRVEARELITDLQRFVTARPGAAVALPASIPTNLPAPLTSFVGRAGEVHAACTLLTTGPVRLLTLTGPGGVGKTRLALTIAAGVVPVFLDGVYLVDLAPLTDATLVLPTIARVLALRDHGPLPVADLLIRHLRGKTLLLLLDNAEHVTAAAPALATLLEACPALALLVTSRRPLHLLGEQEMALRPLAVPDLQAPSALDALGSVPSVALYLQRAQAIQPDMALTPATATDIAAICRRLEGLPLAIELAAAQSRIVAPSVVLARLEQHVLRLSSSARNVPARHQSLRAAIAWSYDLLTADQQSLFAHLALFVGGCTLEATATVWRVTGIRTEDEVLAGLTVLVEASLLQVTHQEDGTPRFTMLETIRAYADEHLTQRGLEKAVRRACTDYYLALAVQAEALLLGPEQDVWLDRLEADYANMRAVLRWAVGTAEGELGLHLASLLWRFWEIRGYWREGRDWLVAALAGAPTAAASLRAAALSGAGNLAYAQSDHPSSRALFEEALALWRTVGDTRQVASLLNNLGASAYDEDDYRRATSLLQESLDLRRALGDALSISATLGNLGLVFMEQGDYSRARTHCEESLAIKRAEENTRGVAITLNVLGAIALNQGEITQARAYHEESLALFRQLGDQSGVALVQVNLTRVHRVLGDRDAATAASAQSVRLFRALGSMRGLALALCEQGATAHLQGDEKRARTALRESLGLYQEIGSTHDAAECLETVAQVCSAGGDAAGAAHLLGAAMAMRDTIKAPVPPRARATYDQTVERIRQALGDDVFNMTYRAGLELRLEGAVPLALALLSAPSH